MLMIRIASAFAAGLFFFSCVTPGSDVQKKIENVVISTERQSSEIVKIGWPGAGEESLFLAMMADGQVALFKGDQFKGAQSKPLWKVKFELGMRAFDSLPGEDHGWIGGISGQLRKIDLKTGREIARYDDAGKDTIVRLLLIPKSSKSASRQTPELLVMASEGGKIAVLETATMQRIWGLTADALGSGKTIVGLESVIHEGSHFLVAGSESKIIAFDAATGKSMHQAIFAEPCADDEGKSCTYKAQAFAMGPSLRKIFVATALGDVKVFDLITGQSYGLIDRFVGSMRELRFVNSRALLVGLTREGVFAFWDMSQGISTDRSDATLPSSLKDLKGVSANRNATSLIALSADRRSATVAAVSLEGLPMEDLADSGFRAGLQIAKSGQWAIQIKRGTFVSDLLAKAECISSEAEGSLITRMSCPQAMNAKGQIHRTEGLGVIEIDGDSADDRVTLTCAFVNAKEGESQRSPAFYCRELD